MTNRKEVAAERFGRNLFMARRRTGYSQEELGELCALHHNHIGQMERGERFPRLDTLVKLVRVLEVSADDLLWGIDWTPPAPASGSFTAVPLA
jgi:transcriptional regulator with XRE-family HTH domain